MITQQELRKFVGSIAQIDKSLILILSHVEFKFIEQEECLSQGSTVLLGNSFLKCNLPQKRALLLRHTLHVCLRHAAMATKLYQTEDNFFFNLYSLACTALLNTQLGKESYAQLRSDWPTILSLVSQGLLDAVPSENLNSVQLYRLLRQKVTADVEFIPEFTLETLSGPEESIENQFWSDLVKASQAGSENGLLNKLALLNTESKIPWYKKLRKELSFIFSDKKEQTWRRQHRRANTTFANSPICLPGVTKKQKPRTIGIGLDTSGSTFDPTIQSLFFAQIQAIQNQLKADIYVISGDTKVTNEILLKPSPTSLFERFRSIEKVSKIMSGGGGTDFRPILKRFEEIDVSVVVLLTDTFGVFPEVKPKYSLLICHFSNGVTPYGTSIPIE